MKKQVLSILTLTFLYISSEGYTYHPQETQEGLERSGPIYRSAADHQQLREEEQKETVRWAVPKMHLSPTTLKFFYQVLCGISFIGMSMATIADSGSSESSFENGRPLIYLKLSDDSECVLKNPSSVGIFAELWKWRANHRSTTPLSVLEHRLCDSLRAVGL